MNNFELLNKVSFNLSSVAHCRLGKEWNYNNIISSFTRLYLITEGDARVFMGDQLIKLRKGYLYLIPSFRYCSYSCPDYMEQYYATFTIHLPDNMSIYQLFNFNTEIKAEAYHFDFFKKLYDLNPNMALPSGDPKIYQKNNFHPFSQRHQNAKNNLSSNGIINLLLAEFIGSVKIDLGTVPHNRLTTSIQYIHRNLDENLVIEKLAEKSCISPDHYTRQFKALTNQTPIDYINRQRIEKAQLMLNTTSFACSEIGYQCGFKSSTYFHRIFKKYVNLSPGEYRQNSAVYKSNI